MVLTKPSKSMKNTINLISLFYFLLFITGLSVGVLLTTFFKTFFITTPSSSTYYSNITASSPPPPLLESKYETSKRVHANTTIISSLHNTSDDILPVRESPKLVPTAKDVVPKVAFMFLTPGPLPLYPLWDMFFKGHEDKFSVYVHTHPSYNETAIPNTSAFYGRRIPSQPVYWGTISMIDAERRLLANALSDPSNERFVLLSDSCFPLFNFTTIYDYLINSKQSFLSSFDDPRKLGRGRYNKQMWPNIKIEQWRKGSQWFEVHRDLALKIASDSKYYKIFQEFCHMPCYNDEHYLSTLVNIVSPEANSNRSVTWVDWSRGGPHPRRFGWIDVKVELLNYIRFGSECMYNGKVTNVCYLFARKFVPSSLRVLVKLAPSVLGYGP